MCYDGAARTPFGANSRARIASSPVAAGVALPAVGVPDDAVERGPNNKEEANGATRVLWPRQATPECVTITAVRALAEGVEVRQVADTGQSFATCSTQASIC